MAEIDKALLLELAGGEAEAGELLTLYFESARDLLSRLHAAADCQDRKSAENVAHQMAGAAGTCGFMRLEEILRSIETSAEKQPWPDLIRSIENAEQLLSNAETEARALFLNKKTDE